MTQRRARSPGRLVAIQIALEALDRANQAKAIIAQEGVIPADQSGKIRHVHPLLKVEAENRKQFLTTWSRLGLLFDGIQDQ